MSDRKSKADAKTQRGANVHFGSTVTPFDDALVRGYLMGDQRLCIGTRARRGTLSDLLATLLDRFFEAEYGMPTMLLREVLEEAGVLQEMPREEGKSGKPRLMPLTGELVNAVIADYRKRLVQFNYGTTGETYGNHE